jgi:hypothetical protein
MTMNRKLEIVAGIGGIVAGLATGGLLPIGFAAGGTAVSALAMLFRDKPETKETKVRRAKETLGQVGNQKADAEEPK